jgi:arylformamidase
MTDAPSVDPADSGALPGHKLLLGRGAPIVEGLVGLERLPVGADFTVCALPLKLEGLEGAPCRAAAWLEDPSPGR